MKKMLNEWTEMLSKLVQWQDNIFKLNFMGKSMI